MNKKSVIITGASRGIGAASAKLFAQHGYAVCINYRANQKAAEDVQHAIQQHGGECIIIQADVAQESEVMRLFSSVDKAFGSLSVLVNNTGILHKQCRLEDMQAERINTILQTNVTSAFLCCREAVRRMSTKHGGQGGSIVNVSSGAATRGSPNEYIDYAASKGAMDTLTIGLSKEVAAEGIRVNGVRPGLIYTEMHASGGEPARVDRLKNNIPMQRGGYPEEVAEAILWLASEKASFTTGSFLEVNGGF